MRTMCVPGVQQGQKRMLDALKLDLLMVFSHHVVAGTQTWDPLKSNKYSQLLSP